MELSIFQGIIYGYLAPDTSTDVELTPLVQTRFNKMPSTLNEAQDWIADAAKCINGQFTPAFDKVPSDTSRSFFNDTYTAITPDSIPVVLDLGECGTYRKERLYGAIINWEGYRIKQYLTTYNAQIQDDSLTRKEVRLTMSAIRKYASELCESRYGKPREIGIPLGLSGEIYKQRLREIDNIIDYLIRKLAWLYYDISFCFSAILKDEDTIPVEDFCEQLSDAFPSGFNFADKVNALKTAHDAQKIALPSSDGISMLQSLYAYKTLNIPTVLNVIDYIENELYRPIIEAEINFSEIDIEKAYRTRFHELDDARAVMDVIEDDIAAINQLGISPTSCTSIPAKVRTYLSGQKPMYEKAIGQILTTSVQRASKNFRPKRVKEVQTLPMRKKIVQEQLRYMSGAYLGRRIMSEEDYKYMLDIVLEFVREGKIPAITKRLNVDMPAMHIRYTFYGIYSQMKKSCCSRDNWVRLITSLFTKFDGTDISVTNKKFSTKPDSYDTDITT